MFNFNFISIERNEVDSEKRNQIDNDIDMKLKNVNFNGEKFLVNIRKDVGSKGTFALKVVILTL